LAALLVIDATFNLSGRTALVTGGGSGIGKAAVQMLAEHGARVAALGKSLAGVQATVDASGGTQKGHLAVEADVSDAAEMQQAFAAVTTRWSRLDILVINAGINGVWCPLDELEPFEWDLTMNVNLRGTFLTLKYALPLLRARGGSVVIVSSINGTRVFTMYGATAYACSKAAQVAFAKMTALELAPDKIRVNVICPGSIKTNIDQSTAVRNLDHIKLPAKTGYVPLTDDAPGAAEEAARLITFLASDASRHISGTEIYLDGAQSLLTV
jgi:NAD(P)-dependent dehydrogenase (short-subunit alcohol dehydrogenase family)